jgi:UDP-N-acetylmuramoyl-tripeptide--D-alanyl-D-alanine ligase
MQAGDVILHKIREGNGISIDSRNIPQGGVFFALKGERSDGNRYAVSALQNGASLAVIDNEEYAGVPGCILVPDVLKMLQKVAEMYRTTLDIPFLAIGGSNGKTTTKELIASVLAKKYKTACTKGNYNNHIGVPLTILSIPPDAEIAVVEIGANHEKETIALCQIVHPDFGLITNNSKDHLEGFGSVEGVRRANGELYDYLKINRGTAFVNTDLPDLREMSAGMNRIEYGSGKGVLARGAIVPSDGYLHFTIHPYIKVHKTKLFGSYNFANVLAAVAVGRQFKVPEEDIFEAITDYEPKMNRSQIRDIDTNRIIFDCYNANPGSMAASIDSFVEMEGKHKMLILADMLELGEHSISEHELMLKHILSTGIKDVILIGPIFSSIRKPPHILCFPDVQSLRDWFRSKKFYKRLILLKGSRGFKLEELFSE